MSKKYKRRLSFKRVRKTIRKNPIAVGATAALLAIGGIAAQAFRRNPQLSERSRELKDNILRRLHIGTSTDLRSEAANSH